MSTKSTAKKKQELFLKALGETGNVSEACRQSTLSRRYAYKLKQDNEEFAAAWQEAEDHAGDALEAEARRRA